MSEPEQQPSDFQGSMSGVPDKTERTAGMVCHLLGLCMFTCIPFANVIAPLILWLVKKDQYPFVDDQGKESINFQITMALAGVVLGMLYAITIVIAGIIGPVFMVFGLLIGLLGLALTAANVVFIILAAIQANNGVAYRYPFSLRLIK